MQIVKLSLKKANKIPIEADNVNPDNFAGKTEEEIKAILVWYGNGQYPLGDFFNVEVEGSDSVENTKIVFEGDVSRVKRIGQNMSAGEIEINGNVDMHCGFSMRGGKIVINGDADSWLGCEMTGGEIILNGNASYYVGSGYRGEVLRHAWRENYCQWQCQRLPRGAYVRRRNPRKRQYRASSCNLKQRRKDNH